MGGRGRRTFIRRTAQTAAWAILLFFLYVFFCCTVSSITLLGFELHRPGDLSVPVLAAIAVLALCARPWRWRDGRAKAALLLLFLAGFCLLFRPHTGSDGAQYYANLRSLWLDGDLNFYDDAVRNPRGFGDTYLGTLHPRGYTYNGFSAGPALFWTPGFLAAHGWCASVNAFVTRYAADGYDDPYLTLVCLTSALAGFGGAALCYRFLRQWTAAGIAAWAAALVTFASPLLLYLFYEATFSHAISFLTGTAVVVVWWKRFTVLPRDALVPSLRGSAILGLVCGLAMLVRWQNGLLLLFPLLDALEQLVRILRARAGRGRAAARWFAAYAVFAVMLLVAVSPQLVVWRIQAGEWLTVPQGSGYIANLWAPQIGKMLTSRLHGLFSWHPVFLVAALCLPFLWKAHRPLLVRSLLVLAGQVYVNSAVHDWWAGGSFGQRRFCAVLVLAAVPLALGLARLVSWGERSRAGRVARSAAVLVSVLLLLSNLFLLTQYLYGPIEPMGKLEPLAYLQRWVGEDPVHHTNAWNKLRDTVIYQRVVNGLVYGALHGDLRVFAGPALLALTAAVAAAAMLWPGLIGLVPGLRRVLRRWPLLATAAVVIFAGVLGLAGLDARPLLIVNRHPAVQFGNVRLLTVARTHRYVGGFMDETLEPGAALRIALDEPVEPRAVVLVSYLLDADHLPPDTAVARLTLEGDDDRRFEVILRTGVHTDADRVWAERPYRGTATAMPQVARRWRPSRRALFNACSWYAEWPLPHRMQVRTVEVVSLLARGRIQLDGIAFWPGGDVHANPVAEVGRRSVPLDFQELCNAAYDHNPFSPRNDWWWPSHFYLDGRPLYNGPVPLQIYPPYDETRRWNCLTTCFHTGQTFRVPLEPPRPALVLHAAFAAGAIRGRAREPLVDFVLVHASGARQMRRLFANDLVFDYLHGYRPAGSVLEGGASSFMYDGRMSVLEVRAERPYDPLVAVEIVDANGDNPAGVSVFSLTAVLPRGWESDAAAGADKER